MAGLVEVLADYPTWVADRILSPKSGLPAKNTFLPSIKEVKEACEAEFRVRRYAQQWDDSALRLKYQGHPALAGPPPAPRPTYEELQAKYGPNWGIRNPDHADRPSAFLSEDDLRAKYGEAFDMIPDQPEGFGKGRFKHLKAPNLR